ncbi:MAG TPA: Flp family type IVb pilin [Longimicrobium sp.]|jgi:pilus assembly protein Flp/PilA
MTTLLDAFKRDESGQSLVEYGLVIALVALAVVGALIIFSGRIVALFGRAGTALDNAGK